MYVNIFNGALQGDVFLDRLTSVIDEEYALQGHSVSSWRLCDYEITCCRGCLECWTHTPGLCNIDDGAQELIASIIRSDLQVYISPVTFGGLSSEIKKVLDRCSGLVFPYFTMRNGKTYLKARYDRYPAIRAIGVLPEIDTIQEEIFRKLIRRMADNQYAPEYAVEFIYRPENTISTVLPMSKPQSLTL